MVLLAYYPETGKNVHSQTIPPLRSLRDEKRSYTTDKQVNMNGRKTCTRSKKYGNLKR